MPPFKLVLGLACALSTLAAQAPITGPVEAIIFDPPSHSFRAVRGTIGAATLGPSLTGRYAFGSVAPKGQHGIAWGDGTCYVIVGLGGDQPAVFAIDGGSSEQPEQASWSQDGTAVVLSSLSGNWVQVIKGLPGLPVAAAIADASVTGGRLASAAIGSEGSTVLVGITGETSGLFELAGGLTFTPLVTGISPIALSFGRTGEEMYAIDRITNQIVSFRLSDRSTTAWSLEEGGELVALYPARSQEGRSVLYISDRDGTLITYDLDERQQLSSVKLPILASTISPLGLNSFLLGSRASEQDPIWSFSGSNEPLIRFVPAVKAEDREEMLH